MSVKIQLDKKKIALGVGDIVAEPLTNGNRVAGWAFGHDWRSDAKRT